MRRDVRHERKGGRPRSERLVKGGDANSPVPMVKAGGLLHYAPLRDNVQRNVAHGVSEPLDVVIHRVLNPVMTDDGLHFVGVEEWIVRRAEGEFEEVELEILGLEGGNVSEDTLGGGASCGGDGIGFAKDGFRGAGASDHIGLIFELPEHLGLIDEGESADTVSLVGASVEVPIVFPSFSKTLPLFDLRGNDVESGTAAIEATTKACVGGETFRFAGGAVAEGGDVMGAEVTSEEIAELPVGEEKGHGEVVAVLLVVSACGKSIADVVVTTGFMGQTEGLDVVRLVREAGTGTGRGYAVHRLLHIAPLKSVDASSVVPEHRTERGDDGVAGFTTIAYTREYP